MDTRRKYKKCLQCKQLIMTKDKNATYCEDCLPTQLRIRLVFDIGKKMREEIDAYALEHNKSRSLIIREAINEYIHKEKLPK